MFSDEQFDEWVDEAKKIAKAYQTLVIGTSHADGSFRGSNVSIPIAYCVDENGQEVFIAKNDIRSRILDTNTRTVEIIDDGTIMITDHEIQIQIINDKRINGRK